MNLPNSFKDVSTFVLDVDGVLTDGTVYVFDSGEQVRRMSIKDGYALQLAVKNGYNVLVVSGGNSPAVVERLSRLGITDVHMGVLDKRSFLLDYMQQRGLTPHQVLYMGDDVPDIAAMAESGLPCAPADAAEEVKKMARYVASRNGGRGCVREVIELTLKLNGHWEIDPSVASQ